MSLWQRMTDKDRQIAASCAFNAAAAYWSSDFMDTLLAQDPNNREGWENAFKDLLQFEFEAFKALLDSIESFDETAGAVAQVQAAFPGAVDVTQQQPTFTQAAAMAPPPPAMGFQQPSNVVPFPQQPPQGNMPNPINFQQPQGFPQQQPQYAQPQQFQPQQQGGGGNKSDADWMDLIQNPQNWNDVRAQKRGQNSPDFVHRFQRNNNGKEKALWLQGRFGPAPQWVFQQLQAQGRI